MKVFVYILACIVFIGLDQFSKFEVVRFIKYNTKIEIIKDFFNLTNVRNFGAGFSILQNQRLFLIVVPIIVVLVLFYLLYTERHKRKITSISYILIISGAIGNLIDRVRLSYVVDFLDFNIFGYDFPVFNLADCFITVGCFLLIIDNLLGANNGKN